MSGNEAAISGRREAIDARTLALCIGFFASGFCSLLYQVIWTRLAFAHFGIITPVLSLIVSVFMLGIGIGSVYGGNWAERLARRGLSPLTFWACMEFVIAIGAFVVPASFNFGETILLGLNSAASATYLAISAVVITITVLPWCVAMGTTVPVVMDHLRSSRGDRENFSLLYLANVFGAMVGTFLTAIALIEIFGLAGTYQLAAIVNLLIAALALILSRNSAAPGAETRMSPQIARAPAPPLSARLILFTTGFSCLGLEICWARDFTFDLYTTIYAFAFILTTYLLATMAGTVQYRKHVPGEREFRLWPRLALLFPAALLPVIVSDPRLKATGLGELLSIVPFSMLLGAVTPALIDRHAKDDPVRAGSLYGVNIAGSIVGPLIAAYILLPTVGIRWAMILLSLPLLPLTLLHYASGGRRRLASVVAAGVTLCLGVFFSRSYDDPYLSIYPQPAVVHRGIVATAIAAGTGRSQMLSVNGVPITDKSIETQIMADLPMALQGHANSALDICFGMGTTFRTLSFWGGDVTAVDLSSSVIRSFGFFYPDTAKILDNPKNRVVVDDGRRFLMRTKRKFDVITIDPPPPIPAAGSSLLYSTQFYVIVKRRLTPDGILQQWVPAEHGPTVQSIALALHQSFPYLEAFAGRGGFGIHFLASMHPIPSLTPSAFISRLPPRAARFLLAWGPPNDTLEKLVTNILDRRIPLDTLLPPPGSGIPALTDNRPFNEYFLLRKVGLMP